MNSSSIILVSTEKSEFNFIDPVFHSVLSHFYGVQWNVRMIYYTYEFQRHPGSHLFKIWNS